MKEPLSTFASINDLNRLSIMGVSLKKAIEKILFVIILSAFAIPTLADPVTPDRASMVAQRFMASAVKAERDQIRIVYTRSMPEAKETAFYVVNVGEVSYTEKS